MNLKKLFLKINDERASTTIGDIPLVAGKYGSNQDGEKSLDRHYGGFQRTAKKK